MTFNINLVPSIDLITQEIDGKRHYVLPSGEAFKSVTTVLGEKLDKSSLEVWKKRVGEEEAARITAVAGARGTIIHRMAENYILNKDYKEGENAFDVYAFSPMKKILDKHINNIIGIELPLFSRALKTAGRTDLIAEFDGVLSIVDYKTSLRIKDEKWIEGYFIQSTCYSLMAEWLYKVPINQIAIIIAVDHESPQVFVKNRKDYIPRVLEIFAS